MASPTPVTLNWERELAHWAPVLIVRRLRGSRPDHEVFYKLPVPVIVPSYEQIRLDIDQIDAPTPFGIVVLDEAQRIKNAESDTAFACRKLPFGRAWALTGTAVENSVSDLLSI
jgi:SNF2 family DNA or RNA helicase